MNDAKISTACLHCGGDRYNHDDAVPATLDGRLIGLYHALCYERVVRKGDTRPAPFADSSAGNLGCYCPTCGARAVYLSRSDRPDPLKALDYGRVATTILFCCPRCDRNHTVYYDLRVRNIWLPAPGRRRKVWGEGADNPPGGASDG